MNIYYVEEKFRKLLCHLYDHNAYYRNAIETAQINLDKDDIASIYKRLPYTNKLDIISNTANYLSDNIDGEAIKVTITSGSSGNVMKCYKTSSEVAKMGLITWRQRRKIDPQITPDNYVNLFSDEVEEQIGHFYNTDPDILISNYYNIKSSNSRWISGPISIIEKFAYLIREGRINYTKGNLQYIEFMGEYIDSEVRKFIEKTFNCITINHYGTQETWCIAYDCKHQHLHILDKQFYLEIINPDKDGYGELALTSLANHYMPIIKYRIGDIGRIVYSPCKCGNAAPRLELTNGRTTDIIYGRNILGNYFFDQLIWEINSYYEDSIFSYSVHQTNVNEFEFTIVRGSRYVSDVEGFIARRMAYGLGEETKVKFDYAESLPYIGSGKLKKFRTYVCE